MKRASGVAVLVLLVLIIVALIYAGRHQPGKQDVTPVPTATLDLGKPVVEPEASKTPTQPKKKPARRVELPSRGDGWRLTERSDGLPSDLLRPGGALHSGALSPVLLKASEQKAEPTSTGAVSPGSTASVSTASGGVGRTDAPPAIPSRSGSEAQRSPDGGIRAGNHRAATPAPYYAGGLMPAQTKAPALPASYDASIAWVKWAQMCEADGGRVSTDHRSYWECRPDCAGQAQWNFAPCPGWQRVSAEYQSGDGGGSSAESSAGSGGQTAAAPGPGPGPGDCK